MLQHLLIKDLAIVEKADITFSHGMTVITGETGAGKSILLDALSLALGERSECHLVRPGAERAEISACFDIASLPGAILWLTEVELTYDESPQQCIIRRILYPNGRSRAFINGRPATTQQLRLLGEHLVQIHGQHQHQLLLKSSEQLRLLDAFGQHAEVLSQVKTIYKEWEKLQQHKQALLQSIHHEEAKRDLLQYQLAEFEALDLGEQELEQLYAEHGNLTHAQTFIEICEQVIALLEDQRIHQAIQAIRPLSEKFAPVANAKECLSNAAIQLQEATSEVNNFMSQLEINPARLETVERRMERIHDIARKHKVEAQHLFAHYETLKTQAQQIAQCEEALKQVDQDIILAQTQYQRFANALTQARQQAAEKFAQKASLCIQQLAMPGAIFTLDLLAHADQKFHAHGNETVVFGISANPGHPPQPLTKVASGGELSRISLALGLITTQFLATPCLVFDEVDVGISGKTGAIVGKALHDLGQSAQVLCVTHLPQVASCGDHHLQVTKIRSDNHTLTQIHHLNEPQRVQEIARMLGGIDVSTQAKAQAKQLLKQPV